MKSKEKKLTPRGLWSAVIILLLGLTIGFLLLATVYTGPVIWKVLVTVIYFVVVILLVKSVRKLSSYLKEQDDKELK